MKLPRYGLWVLVVLLLGLAATVSEARVFKKVGATKGLESRVVPALLVDHEGFLWVGSREGLYRYDGYVAEAFLPDAKDPGGVSDLDIRTLFEADNGDIWVGTNTGGLNWLQRDSDRFVHFRHDSSNPRSLPDDSIYGIAQGPDGRTWATTQQGLARLDPATGDFEVFRHEPGQAGALSHDWTFALHLGASGHLWVTTVGGSLNRWNPASQDFTHYDLGAMTGSPGEHQDVFTVFEDADGTVWAGTREGLIKLHPEENRAEYVDLGTSGGYQPLITSAMDDGQDRLWLTTMTRGILIVNRKTAEWTTATDLPLGAAGSLPSQPQMSLAMHGDVVFTGTWGEGVFRTSLERSPFTLINQNNTTGGLRNFNVSAILANDEPGKPWLGSFGGGPQQVRIEKREIVPSHGRLENIRDSGVLDMTRGTDGNLFAGTTDGLFRFDENGAEVWFEQHAPDLREGIGAGYVYSLLPWEDGGLWVGVGGSGLYLRNRDGQYQHYGHDPGRDESLSGNFITVLTRGMPGYLWVGTRSNGLNRCKVETWSCQRFSAQPGIPGTLSHFHVTDLYRDRRNRLWVATDGGGLNRVVQNDEGTVVGFEAFGREHGLLSDGIMAITEDVDESLWLSTRHGLSRFNPLTGQIVNYVAESGLPTLHFNAKASDDDSRYIYFGSVDGLLTLEKGSLLQKRQPAPVRITHVRAAAPGEHLDHVRLSENHLEVPYGEILALEFATLDYSESAHRYAYRMSADEEWHDLGAQRQIIFHGLAPGSYAFQARGRDVYGMWGETGTLTLEVVPPFWMTAWFRLLLVVALLLFALSLHQLRLRREQRFAREIQRLSEKREAALELALGSEAELAVLTPRQKEVLQLIAEGCTTREIADLLNLSVKTVEAHRANLMERLNIHDVPGLVRLAIRARLVSPHY